MAGTGESWDHSFSDETKGGADSPRPFYLCRSKSWRRQAPGWARMDSRTPLGANLLASMSRLSPALKAETAKGLTVVHAGETSAGHPPLGPGTLLAGRRTRERPQGGPAGRRPWTPRTDSALAARASPLPPLLTTFSSGDPRGEEERREDRRARAATPLLPRGRRGWAEDTRRDPRKKGKRREEREIEG